MPGTSTVASLTATGEKNSTASVGPGCRPERPNAARSRTELTKSLLGKNGSSDITHDAAILGYRMLPKFFPKAEFRSLRSAPVMKRRSRQPTCSVT